MAADDADLLQPSLGEDFEVRRFQRPWSPSSLLWVAFFGGPIGAGLMYTLNYRRLARPRSGWICLLGTLVVSLALVLTVGGLAGRPSMRDGSPDSSRMIRYGIQAICLVIGLGLTHDQSRAFRAFESAGHSPGKALVPALLAIALNIIILLVTLPAAAALLHGASEVVPR